MAFATINHDLAPFRRIFNFAIEKDEIKNALKGRFRRSNSWTARTGENEPFFRMKKTHT